MINAVGSSFHQPCPPLSRASTRPKRLRGADRYPSLPSPSFSYAWGVVSGITTAAHVTTRIVDPEGTVHSETQAGRTTIFTYDDLFRISRTDPPNGTNFILTNYNNTDGSTVAVQRGSSTVTTTLDGFGRPTLTSNSVGIQTRTAYDAEGRKTYEG